MRGVFAILLLLCFQISVADSVSLPGHSSDGSKKLLQDAQLSDVRSAGGSSFRLLAKFATEHAGRVTTDGSYVLLWASPTQWREEVSTSDFTQVRLAGEGGIWEARKPSYQSLRVWQLMQALAFSSRFSLWRDENPGKIKLKKKGGVTFRCIETKWRDSVLRELCFDESSEELAREHYVPSDRTYEFTDYGSIGAKKFPRHIKVYDGKTLAVDLFVEEIQQVSQFEASSFERPAEARWRNWCPNPEPAESWPIIYRSWPPPERHVTLYGAIGTDGRWVGLHILESGGKASDASVLDELGKERWKPATCGGVAVVVETVFRR